MNVRIKAWQCIGCGKLDAPQTCIGVCEERKVELIARSRTTTPFARVDELEGVMRMLAMATPRDGEWERSYRQLQEIARVACASALTETTADRMRTTPPIHWV